MTKRRTAQQTIYRRAVDPIWRLLPLKIRMVVLAEMGSPGPRTEWLDVALEFADERIVP